MTSIPLKAATTSVATVKLKYTIENFKYLSAAQQEAVREAITTINTSIVEVCKETSCKPPGTHSLNWEKKYTAWILSLTRSAGAEGNNTIIFVASVVEGTLKKFVGYTVFETPPSDVKAPPVEDDDNMPSFRKATCRFTAVAPLYRRHGISLALKQEIFKSDPNITAFSGLILKSNLPNRAAIQKMEKLGYKVTMRTEVLRPKGSRKEWDDDCFLGYLVAK